MVSTNKSGWIDLDGYDEHLDLITNEDDYTTVPDEEFEIKEDYKYYNFQISPNEEQIFENE